MATFESLLAQVAARHWQDIDAAVRSLTRENNELRQQVAQLQEAARTGVQKYPESSVHCIPMSRRDHLIASLLDVEQAAGAATPTTQTESAEEHRENSKQSAKSGGRSPSKGSALTSNYNWAVFGDSAALADFQASHATRQSSKDSNIATIRRSSKASRDVCSTGSLTSRWISVCSVDKKMDLINKKQIIKLKKRLQKVLCAKPSAGQKSSAHVLPDKLYEALACRQETVCYSREECVDLLGDLSAVAESLWPNPEEHSEPPSQGNIDISDFAHLLLIENLEHHVAMPVAVAISTLREALIAEDTDEVIARLSAAPEVATPMGTLKDKLSITNIENRILPDNVSALLNTIVVSVVVLSLVFLGVSLDYYPDSPVWTWIECSFAAIFFAEHVIKLYYLGWCVYLLGRDCTANWVDLFITGLTMVDLIGTAFLKNVETSAVNALSMLKVFRLFRFLRVIKLLNNSPALKQLSSMLSGLWIGVPSLLWVNVLLILLIYIVAVLFRSLFIANSGYSPLTPKELISRCGKGDFVERNEFDMPVDPTCKLDLIYGEEFLGSVPKAMMTIFKFITGDTSTAGGRSLTEYLDATESEGVAWPHLPFYFFYVPFMIIVWFGMFNIITAIFVETTITGLKHNDAQNKRKRLYESRYVKKKLTDLTERIDTMAASGSLGDNVGFGDVHLDHQCFVQLMSDAEVKSLMMDLDVIMDESTCTFDMFDPEGVGMITKTEFMTTLLRLRGEPQKIDLVSSWSSLRLLQKSFQDFQQVVISSLRTVEADQEYLTHKFDELKTGLLASRAGVLEGSMDLWEQSTVGDERSMTCSVPQMSL